jgi:hypothetical protein
MKRVFRIGRRRAVLALATLALTVAAGASGAVGSAGDTRLVAEDRVVRSSVADRT